MPKWWVKIGSVAVALCGGAATSVAIFAAVADGHSSVTSNYTGPGCHPRCL